VRLTRGGMDLLITVCLEELEQGTRMRWRMKVELPLPRWLLEKIALFIIRRRMHLQTSLDELERLVLERGSDIPAAIQA
jgi:hypothetical protein